MIITYAVSGPNFFQGNLDYRKASQIFRRESKHRRWCRLIRYFFEPGGRWPAKNQVLMEKIRKG